MRISLILGLLLAAACGDDDRRTLDGGPPEAGRDGRVPGDAAALDGTAPDAQPDAPPPDSGSAGCPRAAAAADRTRYVVVSHPFAAGGGAGDLYEVLLLDTSGVLTQPGVTFAMGTAHDGAIAFSPDGEIGIVAQEDGSVGVFRFGAGGEPEVVEAAYGGSFYAGAVVMDPSGAHAWVLDQQWRESGGGVYRLDIGCDGSVLGDTRVAEARLPYAMIPRDDGTALLVAKDVADSSAGADAHIVRLDGPTVVASADVFADDDWIVSSAALTRNGRHFLFADNAAFASTGVRVGVVEVAGDALVTKPTVMPIEDPIAIVASPFDDAAIVPSGFGDAIFVLDYAPDASAPFTLRGELAYAGARPALPGAAVAIERGSLDGLVLVAENVSVRRVRFEGGGTVTDLGAFGLGSGSTAIVGAIGVTP